MSKHLVSHEILLTHFFTACDNSFHFMCQQYGFEKFTGIVEFHKGRKIIKPPKLAEQDDNFLAICRLEKDEIAIEFTYDGNDLIIDSHVYYDFINRFSIIDIIGAAKKSEPQLHDQHSVMTSESLITKRIGELGDCIEAYPHLFTKLDEKLINRAINIRSKRMEHSVREQHRRNMDKAIERAAKAFRDKDYRRVVELLKPFEHSLLPSDKKKYKRAVDQLTNAHKA